MAGTAQTVPPGWAAPGAAGGDLLAWVRGQLVGDDAVVPGPFGPRRLVYADYTASGRAVLAIEEFLLHRVLPSYANTHTESSWTGRQTHRLREEARQAIRAAVGGDDEIAVIFTGSGATAAVDKLAGILGLRLPSALDDRFHLTAHIPPDERPVVLIGPYEHHSNELPWRESVADVVVVPEDRDGRIDTAALAAALEQHRDRPLRVGSFSAASNVTGIRSDVAAVTRVLHAHGALACWDYAAAAPYLPIRMGRPADGPDYLDAVFFSPHKLPGGPGSPGVLVVRRELVTNRVPVVPGGGTVAYVGPERQDYLADAEAREEGGTPDILGAIRAGLAVRLREAVSTEVIRTREQALWQRARAAWAASPAVRVLGSPTAERLPIASIVVRREDWSLHHNFVSALLNDLFGIQARGGCSCAGPYGHRLLGIDDEHSRAFERAILAGHEGLKPGWTRLNLNYFLDEATVDYLLAAVDLVATHGWRLLHAYRFDLRTGLWRHRAQDDSAMVRLADCPLGGSPPPAAAPAGPAPSLGEALLAAERILTGADQPDDGTGPSGLPPELESLRWFPLPAACLRD